MRNIASAGKQIAPSMCWGSAPIAEECCVVVDVDVDFGALAPVALVVMLALEVEFEAEAMSCNVPNPQ